MLTVTCYLVTTEDCDTLLYLASTLNAQHNYQMALDYLEWFTSICNSKTAIIRPAVAHISLKPA